MSSNPVRWFSPTTPVFSTNKTDRRDRANQSTLSEVLVPQSLVFSVEFWGPLFIFCLLAIILSFGYYFVFFAIILSFVYYFVFFAIILSFGYYFVFFAIILSFLLLFCLLAIILSCVYYFASPSSIYDFCLLLSILSNFSWAIWYFCSHTTFIYLYKTTCPDMALWRIDGHNKLWQVHWKASYSTIYDLSSSINTYSHSLIKNRNMS